jgi:SSS family solute:Na+ symporter
MLIGVQSILDAWWILSGLFIGGMLGLFLLGMVSRTAKRPAAVIAVITGVLVIAWMTVSLYKPWPESLEPARSPFDRLLIPVIGTMSIVLVGALRGRFFPRRERGDVAEPSDA